MTFDEVNDDIALPVKPFKVIAALAVHGRLPLLEHTIRRLYEKNGCYKVICSGDGQAERALCEELGAIWVHARNKPLGNKWNQSFRRAQEFNPDAIVFVGSSDWLSDDWFRIMKPYVDTHGFAGVPGCHLADLGREEIRLVNWPGYVGERSDECIGVGRMLSRRLLDAIDWLPFDPQFDNSLDRSMKDRSILKGYHDFMVRDSRLNALSLSAPYWPNKHKFNHHWYNLLRSDKIENPEEWLSKNFPEAIELYKKLGAMNLPNYTRTR